MKKSYTSFFVAILSLLLSTTCTSALAAKQKGQKWYQVELILFATTNPQETASERWPEIPAVINVEKKVALVSSKSSKSGASTPFGVLDKSEYRLTVSANKLKNSRNYDLLLHIGWRQPVFRSKDKAAVYLRDELNTSINQALLDASRNMRENAITSGRLNTFSTFSNDTTHERDGLRYFGAFKLSLSRFLHIDIDMIYRGLVSSENVTDGLTLNDETQEDNTANNNSNNNAKFVNEFYTRNGTDTGQLVPQDYHLLTSRRVKPDEIHYFDHPKFGLITMVTRYEPPKPEDKATATIQPFIP